AVLASDNIQHGPVEILLTIDEEAGMTGASNLEPNLLEAEILLNTDSEQEGEVYVGCAGGIDSEIFLPLEKEPVPEGIKAFELSLKGLCGGHSGVDIHLGRANANKLMGRFLAKYAHELEIKVAKFTGGSLRNAIPREVFLTGVIPEHKLSKLNISLEEYLYCIKQEFSSIETNLNMSLSMTDETLPYIWTQNTQNSFINLLNAIPNGVMRMSSDFSGIVETSLNVGVITTEEEHISIISLIRSLIDSGKEEVEGILTSLSSLSGAKIEFSGQYPGWKPDPDSEIMKLFRSIYENMYGHKPNIMVIHAGLECGLFKKPYPHMDMISFGPTIKHPHSPDEMVEIKTVEQFWQQLTATLENIPEK
ncbi:beta-Ala-His dipeptidase, partial [Vibrio nitrifigilis]